MRWWKGVGKGRVSQWWVILAVVVMFIGSPAVCVSASVAKQEAAQADDTAGTYRVEIAPLEREAAPGRYIVRMEELRPAAERDQTRLAAERAFAEAERLADQKNVDAIRQAIAKYEEAARLYHTLGERGKEAVCLAGIGKVYSDLGEKQKALEYYTQALAIIRAVGDRAGKPRRSTTSAGCTSISARSRRRWSTTPRRWPSIAPWGIGPGKPRRSTISARCTPISARSRRRWSTSLRRWPSSRRGGSGRGSHDAQQHRQGVLRSRREAEGAGVLHSGAGPPSRRGDRAGEATTLNNIGWVYSDLGEKQKALEYYTQALALIASRGGSGRGSHDAQQHRQGVLRSRREAEGAGVPHPGAGPLPRRGESGRGSHDAQQHRRGVRCSWREAEGAGVLHPGAGPLPSRGGSGRGSHDAPQHRRGVRCSWREAEGAGVLHAGAGHHSSREEIGQVKPPCSPTSARCTSVLARSRRRWSTTLRRWPSHRAEGGSGRGIPDAHLHDEIGERRSWREAESSKAIR
jgi:tetratricopeptide (TPR) repeat protein